MRGASTRIKCRSWEGSNSHCEEWEASGLTTRPRGLDEVRCNMDHFRTTVSCKNFLVAVFLCFQMLGSALLAQPGPPCPRGKNRDPPSQPGGLKRKKSCNRKLLQETVARYWSIIIPRSSPRGREVKPQASHSSQCEFEPSQLRHFIRALAPRT